MQYAETVAEKDPEAETVSRAREVMGMIILLSKGETKFTLRYYTSSTRDQVSRNPSY